MRLLAKSFRGAIAVAHLLAPLTLSTHAMAQPSITLPAPYASRALDAVLLPINADVRTEFGLAASDSGVLVLAVQPNGVAAQYGIEPGDVIQEIGGRKVAAPIDIDVYVLRALRDNTQDFEFSLFRAGAVALVSAVITLELYEETLSVSEISTWESWSVSEFSYSEFVSEYSEEIEESYETSETTIETEVSEEESTEETSTSEETVTEEDSAEEEVSTDDEVIADEADDEASGDLCDDGTPVEDGCDDAADDSVDEDSSDDTGDADVDAGEEDGGDDSGGEEE